MEFCAAYRSNAFPVQPYYDRRVPLYRQTPGAMTPNAESPQFATFVTLGRVLNISVVHAILVVGVVLGHWRAFDSMLLFWVGSLLLAAQFCLRACAASLPWEIRWQFWLFSLTFGSFYLLLSGPGLLHQLTDNQSTTVEVSTLYAVIWDTIVTSPAMLIAIAMMLVQDTLPFMLRQRRFDELPMDEYGRACSYYSLFILSLWIWAWFGPEVTQGVHWPVVLLFSLMRFCYDLWNLYAPPPVTDMTVSAVAPKPPCKRRKRSRRARRRH